MSRSGLPFDDASGFYGPFPAPAKLNLFLHVIGRRGDGYHELQTVFQFLDYGDRLWFRPRDDGGIRRVSELPGVPPAADLVVRAARLLAEGRSTCGADIRVEKRIPMGGGLGGGSSDAAAVLTVLNRLWGINLDREALAAMGLELGADVPVFVHGQAAWAEGVGEKLTPVELPEPWYLVIVPPVSISTAGIFSDPQLTRDARPSTIADFLRQGGRNDCEPVVRRRFPQVDEVMAWLDACRPARLTGTGAGVFASFDTRDDAQAVLASLPARWQGFVARGCNVSPLGESMNSG